MSHNLVQSFDKGHYAIAYAIDQVNLVVRNYEKARLKLPDLSESLIRHLERQSPELFERMNECLSGDPKAIKMVEFLVHDLKELRIKTLEFFDKYSPVFGNSSARLFTLDFVEFSKFVAARIKIEEEYMFPFLERLPGE